MPITWHTLNACGIDNCISLRMSKPALLHFAAACPQPTCKDLYSMHAVSTCTTHGYDIHVTGMFRQTCMLELVLYSLKFLMIKYFVVLPNSAHSIKTKLPLFCVIKHMCLYPHWKKFALNSEVRLTARCAYSRCHKNGDISVPFRSV